MKRKLNHKASRILKESLLTQEELKKRLYYDPVTGIFIRIFGSRPCTKIGYIAGTKARNYIRIRILGRQYMAHRLAFLYMTGGFPKEQVDHINHVRNDNRWINLRSVTEAENKKNGTLREDNPSGVNGVSWYKLTKKWEAIIRANGKNIYLGFFDDWFEAVCARKSANNKYGYHANHGGKKEHLYGN